MLNRALLDRHKDLSESQVSFEPAVPLTTPTSLNKPTGPSAAEEQPSDKPLDTQPERTEAKLKEMEPVTTVSTPVSRLNNESKPTPKSLRSPHIDAQIEEMAKLRSKILAHLN